MNFLSTYALNNRHIRITRQTNRINLNKLNTLKHGNNEEIIKPWLSMKFQTRKYFSQELKYFFSIGVWQTVAFVSLLLLKLEKLFRKGY